MKKENMLAAMMFGGAGGGGGGGGLPTPLTAGRTLRTKEDGEDVVWDQPYIHDPSDGFFFELGFDGETWTSPNFNFAELTNQYKTHPLVFAVINGASAILQPSYLFGFSGLNFNSAILPLDDLGLTGMVGFIHLFYDGDAPGGWGIALYYWSASTL